MKPYFLLLALSLTLPLSQISAQEPAAAVKLPKEVLTKKVEANIWVRKPGKLGDKLEGNPATIDMTNLTLDGIETKDLQFGGLYEFSGLYLRDIIGGYSPLPTSADFMLLHMANGMVVPVAVAKLRDDRQVFIAVAIREGKSWTSSFPASIRPDPIVKDSKPIQFKGNKLVVGADWETAKDSFTPWRYVDSLVGIEFIEWTAYFNQFRTKHEKSSDRGREIYQSRCHFCHSMRGIGGKFGPDFATAVSEDKQAWEALYNKVAGPKSAAEKLSHSMPSLNSFSKSDAKALVRWINVARKDMAGDYVPTYRNTFK